MKVELINIPADELDNRIKESFATASVELLKDHQKLVKDLGEKVYMLKQWLTLEETAKMLNGVKPETVRKLYTKQGLKYSKVGQNLFFHIDDINKFIEDRRVKKAS